jgi:MFS transporter, SP family, galactose:H+ symporter
MYQLMITIGIVLAFLSNTWLAFGGVTGGHWRTMLGVIAIPAAIMFLGVLFLPESPRWLFLKGFKDRAVAVFKGMHLDEAEIAAEVKEIEDNLKIKQNGFEMFNTNPNFRRVPIVTLSSVCQSAQASQKHRMESNTLRCRKTRWHRIVYCTHTEYA